MIRTLIATGAVALGATLAAPPANADTAGFNGYLADNGVDTSTAELARTNYNLGEGICGLFGAHADQGDSADVTRLDAMDQMTRGGRTSAEAATWVVGSVKYLCPQYKSILGLT